MEDRPLHLTALVRSSEHVCCRYRLAALRPFLERAGHSLEMRSWPSFAWKFWRLLGHLRRADLVIVQRLLLPWWQLRLLRRAARLLVYDFDDAVFLRDSYAAAGMHSSSRLRRFAAMVQAADAVAAGNSFLQLHAGRWTTPKRLHVIATCIDPGRYSLGEKQPADRGVKLVWIGSSSTLRGLEAVRPLLESIGRGCPGVSLKLICDRFMELESMPVQPCPWAEATEARDLAAADIGISWLPDDPWSRGKCGLKVLQYMAAGLPVVANPVGVQTEMVRHGENGFLASTSDQWVAAIGRLACDPGLRQRMGLAGRRRVEKEYSTVAAGQQWLALLAQLRERRPAEFKVA
jgi:glycosyltransferase involved in cell wall biosynthesis